MLPIGVRDSEGHVALRLTESDVCSLTVCSLVTLPVKTEKSEERRVKSGSGGRAARSSLTSEPSDRLMSRAYTGKRRK